MSEHIRVPEPVYERLNDEADKRGISMGAVVESWMREVESDP